ncbi:MAG: ornithine cyclodeaminase [Actinobacteria bacterium HGW-Actinobacteria-4]|nr:MAG: ornithine cyclodeaminase [Actinobacteria bacterium HGW-Actinobacteria-4]
MTEFMGVRDAVRWVSMRGIEPIVTELVEYLEQDFRRWGEFDKAPRVAKYTPLGAIELMPTCDAEFYAFKYVNGHPSNPARGFQTVVAFGVLANVHNGYPVFMAEMTLLTALRTAATSAMAAGALARPDSRVLALIGAGSQSEFQALAMRAIVGIDTVMIYDRDQDAAEKCARNLKPMGLHVTVASSAAEACAHADIVTTCTADKSVSAVLTDNDVRPGVHINAIGGDCPGKTELDPAILDRGPVFVEFPPQTRIEGEIQAKPADFPVTELWKVLSGLAPGRTDPDQVTIFDSVGFAIEDFSVLRYARDQARGTDYARPIDLIAEPEDPKDLFGLIHVLSPVK